MTLAIRKIIHIDMDAFFASVEQRDNPDLKNRPVAVGGSGRRGVVAAASYEARQFGVYSAMSSVIAKQKCPELIFVKPRFDVYKSVSRQIQAVFKQYTDLVEPLSLDEAYLDVTQNKKGLTTATEIAKQLKQRIKQETNLTASAGVSINKFLAKIASDYDKPDGLFVIKPQQAQRFIDQLEVKKFYGVGKVTAQKMHALGIYHGIDLKQWSQPDLVEQFGKTGRYFHDIAHGIDNRPVQSNRVRKSIGAERTFEKNQDSLDELLHYLNSIAQDVSERVNKIATSGRTITLKIKFSDFCQITRSLSVTEAVFDFETIFSTASQLLEDVYQPGMQIRLLGITLSNLNNQRHNPVGQLTLKI
jgi:DNA polymerase-4